MVLNQFDVMFFQVYPFVFNYSEIYLHNQLFDISSFYYKYHLLEIV